MISRLQDKSAETKSSETKSAETKSARPAVVPSVPKLDGSMIENLRHDVERFIGQHPGTVLAISLGVGFLIGWWNKRK